MMSRMKLGDATVNERVKMKEATAYAVAQLMIDRIAY
jgi:hypothetical protein